MDNRPVRPAQSTSEPPLGWPTGVRPISVEGLDSLGVGEDGSIYWEGKPIEVRKSVALTRWQAIGAVITVAGAILGGIGAAASAVHEWLY